MAKKQTDEPAELAINNAIKDLSKQLGLEKKCVKKGTTEEERQQEEETTEGTPGECLMRYGACQVCKVVYIRTILMSQQDKLP